MSASRIVMLACVVALSSCGGSASYNMPKDENFRIAVEASLANDHARAAGASWAYVAESTVDDPKYDRALLVTANALEQLGLTYAASLYYLDVAHSRRNTELLDKAVGGLERIVIGLPHDTETLVGGFLATSDITGLTTERRAFVNFIQGREAARQGLDEWSDQLFSRIPSDSPYRHRAKFVSAVRLIGRAEHEAAGTILASLEGAEDLPADLRTEVTLALARMLLEQQKYDEALAKYEQIRRLAPERPTLLVEMAWAQYYKGDSRRALGLLLALDAPVYGGLIAPERYLLEAFALRRICQFEPARLAAVRLRDRHGDALDDLHTGVAPMESAPLRRAARIRSGQGSASRFLVRVSDEKRLADAHAGMFGARLSTVLQATYARGIQEATRREAVELGTEVDHLVEELLEAEDGVRLILHELAVELLRGRRRPAGAAEARAVDVSPGGDRVVYPFQSEFWTDEIDDLVVVLPDRCIE